MARAMPAILRPKFIGIKVDVAGGGSGTYCSAMLLLEVERQPRGSPLPYMLFSQMPAILILTSLSMGGTAVEKKCDDERLYQERTGVKY